MGAFSARRAFLAAAALAVVAQLASAAVGFMVDTKNFQSGVVDSPNVVILEFYSPRCGTCQEFAPIFAGAADRLKGKFTFGTVSIDDDAGMELAQQLDVLSEGIPNVRAFVAKGSSDNVRVFTGWELPNTDGLVDKIEKAVGEALQVDVKAARTPLAKK